MENPSELWLKRDHKHDLAFRPLETALEKGVIDAIYTQSKPLQHLQEATGKFKAIEDLSRYPDWTLQVANIPAAITCTDVMAEKHPELAVTFMKGMIKVGRWANEHKHAAAAILDKQTFYLDVEDTYRGIKHIDMVPNLSPQNLASVEIGKDFMLSHGYIKNDFDVHEVGRAGVPGAGGDGTAGGRVEEGNHGQASRCDGVAGIESTDGVAGARRSRKSRATGRGCQRTRHAQEGQVGAEGIDHKVVPLFWMRRKNDRAMTLRIRTVDVMNTRNAQRKEPPDENHNSIDCSPGAARRPVEACSPPKPWTPLPRLPLGG